MDPGKGALEWAPTQFNITLVEVALFEKIEDSAYLDHAMQSARNAQEVYVAAQAAFYVEKVARLIAEIDALREGAPG